MSDEYAPTQFVNRGKDMKGPAKMRDITHHSGQEPQTVTARRRELVTSFKDDENGSLVIFAVIMILMILTMGGIGVDLMRSERDRATLQHTLDRAILAAADLDQDRAPETVVNDYFEAAGLESFLSNVSVRQGLNYKTVGAELNLSRPQRS